MKSIKNLLIKLTLFVFGPVLNRMAKWVNSCKYCGGYCEDYSMYKSICIMCGKTNG